MRKVIRLIGVLLLTFLSAELLTRLSQDHSSFTYSNAVFLRAHCELHYDIQLNTNEFKRSLVSINSNGLRGKEIPRNECNRIIIVGSSTSRATYLDDEQTWPFMLEDLMSKTASTWIGNAGMDGSTSYANMLLMNEHLKFLGADTILFLVGINDRGKTYPTNENTFLTDRPEPNWKKALRRSELANLVHRILDEPDTLNFLARKAQIPSSNITLRTDTSSLASLQIAYQKNLFAMISAAREYGSVPILITHPILSPESSWSGTSMRIYNNTMRKLAQEENVRLIDLEGSLQKNSEYYVDSIHFSRKGNEAIAKLIHDELVK